MQALNVNKSIYASLWYKLLHHKYHRYLIAMILNTQQKNGFIVKGIFEFSYISLNDVSDKDFLSQFK